MAEKEEKPNWSEAEEKLGNLKQNSEWLEAAIKKRKLKWAEKDLEMLIAHAGVIGKKLKFENVILQGNDLLSEWHDKKLIEKLGIKRKIVGAKEAYKIWAKEYDKTPNIVIDIEKNRFMPLLGNIRGKKILDLGCGTGRNAIALAKKGAIVYGIDFSKEMLAEAKKKAKKARVKIGFIPQDITKKLPYERGQFDIIISDLVFNHIKNIGPLFKEISRILKPNGFCVATDIHPYFFEPKRYNKPIPFAARKQGIWLNIRRQHTFPDYIDASKKAGLGLSAFEYAQKKGERPLLLIIKMMKRH